MRNFVSGTDFTSDQGMNECRRQPRSFFCLILYLFSLPSSEGEGIVLTWQHQGRGHSQTQVNIFISYKSKFSMFLILYLLFLSFVFHFFFLLRVRFGLFLSHAQGWNSERGQGQPNSAKNRDRPMYRGKNPVQSVTTWMWLYFFREIYKLKVWQQTLVK